MAIRIGNFSRFDGPRKGFTPPRSRVIFPGHYMKAPWIVLLTVLAGCAVALGIKWQTEMTRANSLAGIVAKIEAQNTKLTQDLAVAKERVSSLESESQQLRAARAMRRVRLEPGAAPDAAATPDDTKPKGRDGFLAKMFKDPEMRKMLAAQQAAALRGFYSDFVKQAHMTPDEADKFFQLLQERQMALMDSSANMLAGSPIDVKSATAATNTADDALKDLLGPDRFTQYQAFEKTLGDRIQVQQFSQQLGAVGSPLQDYQSQALIQIMSQERTNLPSLQSSGSPGVQQALNMTPDQIQQYSDAVNAMNQRVYNRAISILTPSQLSAFSEFQKSMATAQVAGLKMTQQMFKGGQ